MKQLKKIHLIVLFIIVFIQTVNAQHIKSVHGEYTYYVPENITLDIAKQTALQRAKVQALEQLLCKTTCPTLKISMGNLI